MPFTSISSNLPNGQNLISWNEISTANFIASTEGDWSTVPTNLSAMFDNNPSTKTTKGIVYGYPYRTGYLIMQSPSIILNSSIIEINCKIFNNQSARAYWGIEYLNNDQWVGCYGIIRPAPPSGAEALLRITLSMPWQRFRAVLMDTGTHSCEIEIFGLKVFVLS